MPFFAIKAKKKKNPNRPTSRDCCKIFTSCHFFLTVSFAGVSFSVLFFYSQRVCNLSADARFAATCKVASAVRNVFSSRLVVPQIYVLVLMGLRFSLHPKVLVLCTRRLAKKVCIFSFLCVFTVSLRCRRDQP